MRALALLLLAVFARAEPQLIVLEGTVSAADHQSYLRLPFDVPPATERLSVRFEYERGRGVVLDLGLEDPERLRGWSGGNKREFFVSETAATPSYLPGPLPAGRWRLLVGVPMAAPATPLAYRAEVTLSRGVDAWTAPLGPAPHKPGPRWYRGDLHLHSGHSDGSCRTVSGGRGPCPVTVTLAAAAARGLDFVALTEHNTRSQHQALAEAQLHYDTLLLLPGLEVTTFRGHFNLLGTLAPLDFTLPPAQLLSAASETGGVIIINHPALPSDARCLGCGWQLPLEPEDPVLVEVASGGAMRADGGSAEGALGGIGFWEALLKDGRRATAIGASDNHDPQDLSGSAGAVGRPVTVMRAASLEQGEVLAALVSGRVFVDLDASAERVLDLAASAASGRAVMGETLLLGPGPERVDVSVRVEGIPYGRLRLLSGDGAVRELPLSGPEVYDVSVRVGAAARYLRAEVRDPKGRLRLLSNPIYLREGS